MVMAILNALVAIPQIASYVEQAVAAATLWWVQRQQAQTLSSIADAAALAAKAQTDEDRYKATDAWANALKLPRVSK